MNGTKEQILNTALALFSQNGFEAVSVSDIAGRLGITKGALYKHFKNKQDIFDSILSRMERLYSQVCLSWTSCTDEYSSDADTPPAVKASLSFCSSCFSFWTNDFLSCGKASVQTLSGWIFPNTKSPATGVKMEGEKRSVPGFRSV